jgi:hypothetical protein
MQPNNPYYAPQQGGVPPAPLPPQPPYGGPGAGVPPVMPGGPGIPPQMSQNNSKHHRPVGLLVAIFLLSVLLLGAIGFGYWAFTERQDYKLKSDEKVAAAVEIAKQETTDANNLRFAEESKNPLKEYQGSSALGSIKLSYPKTWSGYIDQLNTNSNPLLAKFHPGVVPATTKGTAQQPIALTVSVLEQPYDQVIASRNGLVENGDLKASPYALPKMSDEIGMKFVGKISYNFTGTEIILPLRDKTLLISTETNQYINDFNKYILPNITFVP